MSDIEKLTAYHSIKPYLSEDDQQDLTRKLGLDETNLAGRIKGLTNEDEFCLILYHLECCKHMTSFDEGTSFFTKSYSPDMLIQLKDGETLFVEIKSKHDKSSFKISSGNLKKRMEFACDFNIPLYFAIKIRGHWGLFTSNYLLRNSGKITFPSDMNNSVFNQKFNGEYYIFPDGFKIESEYSQTGKPVGGIRHPKYGNLVSYKFFYEDKLLIEANQEDSSKIGLSLLLEFLQDQMSIQSQDIKTYENGNTIIVEKMLQMFACSDYSLFLSPICHTLDNRGNQHDANSFTKSILEDRSSKNVRDRIKNLLIEFIDIGVPIVFTNSITLNKNGSFKAELDESE